MPWTGSYPLLSLVHLPIELNLQARPKLNWPLGTVVEIMFIQDSLPCWASRV